MAIYPLNELPALATGDQGPIIIRKAPVNSAIVAGEAVPLFSHILQATMWTLSRERPEDVVRRII
jgi:hypothetical protein